MNLDSHGLGEAVLFIDKFSGASSAEVGPVDPQGSMETLALSSRHPPVPGTPLDSRELPEPTVEMDTLGSDLSRWGWALPCDCALPFAAGEMGIISNSLFRMALEMDTLPLFASFSATRCTQSECVCAHGRDVCAMECTFRRAHNSAGRQEGRKVTGVERERKKNKLIHKTQYTQ